MADTVRRIEYFTVEVADQAGAAFQVLSTLKNAGVNLLVAVGFPTAKRKGQLSLVPADPQALSNAARLPGIKVGARKQAFFIQGADRLGVVAELLKKLADAKINVTAFSATTAQQGGFGMILWVKPEDVAKASSALGV
jgi:hypothetical protein